MSPLNITPDYGKDDSTLEPGWWAEAGGHIAGPGKTDADIVGPLIRHLREEGHLMDDEGVDVHTWLVQKIPNPPKKAIRDVSTQENRDFWTMSPECEEIDTWPEWRRAGIKDPSP